MTMDQIIEHLQRPIKDTEGPMDEAGDLIVYVEDLSAALIEQDKRLRKLLDESALLAAAIKITESFAEAIDAAGGLDKLNVNVGTCTGINMLLQAIKEVDGE